MFVVFIYGIKQIICLETLGRALYPDEMGKHSEVLVISVFD